MNQFGHNFRLAIWGESHGHQIGISLDGVPAGIPLSEEDFAEDLARRRSGAPGTTPRREPDVPQIVSGVYDGYTTGAPLTIEFANTNTHSQDYSTVMRHYRPSHADLVAYHKFAGFNDPRGGGHFSARLTVALVAAGVVAKKMLPASIRFATRLTEIGGCTDPERFNEVLHADQTTTLLLETMAGKGSEVGRTFEEIARIIDGVKLSDHVGVCLDTCHIWDAGYDIAGDLDGVVREFDQVIGLDRLKAIHLNDSLNPCGAHKDRHARIGEGHIGFEALSAVTKHPTLRDLPFYLETPNDKLSGWGEEIANLRATWESE